MDDMQNLVQTNLTPQDESGPLYARIHRELADRIVRGTYAVGALMPTEVELAVEFATSRSTIREALRSLTEDGLVERRQGMGTRVISTQAAVAYYQSLDSLQELLQVALDTYMVILDERPVVLDETLAPRVGGKVGERWLLIEGMRWTAPGGRPICYIESYVPERFEHLLPEFHGLQGPFFDLLERRSREVIREVQQDIRSVEMPVRASRMLGLADKGHSLQLLRRYITDKGTMIASCNWHPADQMIYTMKIKRARPQVT